MFTVCCYVFGEKIFIPLGSKPKGSTNTAMDMMKQFQQVSIQNRYSLFQVCSVKHFLYRDDDFPDGLSHSQEREKLRDDLEKLRIIHEKFERAGKLKLGFDWKKLIRKVGHSTKSIYRK